MKKFFALVVIFCSAVVLVGCGRADDNRSMQYSWTVGLQMRHELSSEMITDGAVDSIREHLTSATYDKDINFNVRHIGAELRIDLRIADFDTFLTFVGQDLDDLDIVDFEVRERLFFIERTQTFENPLHLAMNRLQEINQFVRTQANVSATAPENFFVFRSTFRRSNVEGAYESRSTLAAFYYYFNSEAEYVVLFDRFANQPIWYAIGLLSAGVFMGGLFLVLRKPNTLQKPESVVE